MFFHQQHNSIGDDIYNAFVYDEISWMPHLHKGFELALVLDGAVKAENSGITYELHKGEAMIVLPYRLHSYSPLGASKTLVIVFSGNYANAFSRLVANSDAQNHTVKLSDKTFDYAAEIMLSRQIEIANITSAKIAGYAKPELLKLKAALYAVTAELAPEMRLIDAKTDGALVFKMISYIENNYSADIGLHSMADALGYDFRYLSRLFSKTFGVNFKTLVNQYRCDKAKTLIIDTDDTLSEIALGSGFQSIRTFNRVFKEMTGEYPSSLRKQHP